MKFLKHIAIFILFIFPFIGSAQLAHLDNLDIKISPSYPKPNQTVTVEAITFSFNENLSYFTWYIDGIITKEGVRETKMEFDTGKANTKSIITLVVTTENNLTLEEQVVVQPTDVTLLWEAQTEVPLFYKGKSLHTPGSEIKFIAIPNIFQNNRKISSRNLSYTWERNGKILGSLSGIGKSSILLENDRVLKDMRVSVVVETPDKLVAGKDSVGISVGNPEILLYRDDALLGVRYNTSIFDTFNLNDSEITIVSESFFFSSQDELSYLWKINGTDSGNTDDNITLNAPREGEGTANISVAVKNTSKLLQVAKNTFSIKFGTPLLDSLFNF